MKARFVLSLTAVFGVLALGGCGDGGVSGDGDPASLAPADTPLYVQGVLRPQGRLKGDVEALASTISGFRDPTGELIDLLDQSMNEEPTLSGKQLSFARDIEPWLGDRAGVVVDGFAGDPPVVAIIETTDADATGAFLDASKQRGDEDRSYSGVDYLLDGDDSTAAGVVDDFLVFGDEKGFKDAVDVADGDDSLAERGEFTTALDEAPPGSLADAYVSLEAVTDAIRREDPDSAKGFEASVGETTEKTVLASLVPAGDHAELDLITNAELGIAPADLTELIGTFPAESFAALAAPDIGDRIKRVIDQLERAGVEGVSREAIDQRIAATGTSLEEITSALGDLGVFAQGSSERRLQGAAVITTDDPPAAKDLIGRLADLVLGSPQPGVSRADVGTGVTLRDPEELGPQPLTIATVADRIAIGYGPQATERALLDGGGQTLAGDPTFKRAILALDGTALSGFVAPRAVFRLADSLGAVSDPGYRKARPYLRKATFLALGVGAEGDLATTKLVIGFAE